MANTNDVTQNHLERILKLASIKMCTIKAQRSSQLLLEDNRGEVETQVMMNKRIGNRKRRRVTLLRRKKKKLRKARARSCEWKRCAAMWKTRNYDTTHTRNLHDGKVTLCSEHSGRLLILITESGQSILCEVNAQTIRLWTCLIRTQQQRRRGEHPSHDLL